MSDYTEDGLFREINEELKQDRALKIWQTYKIYIIAAIALPVICVVSYQGWHSWKLMQRTDLSEQYLKARELAIDEPNKAKEVFINLAQDSHVGYKILSKFQTAAQLTETKDKMAAVEAYDELIDDLKINKVYRDLARLLSAIHSIEFNVKPSSKIIDELSFLITDANPWRFSALELKAFLYKTNGKTAEAKEIYQKLLVNPQTSSGIRERSQAIMLSLPN